MVAGIVVFLFFGIAISSPLWITWSAGKFRDTYSNSKVLATSWPVAAVAVAVCLAYVVLRYGGIALI
jgi:hypothetical protein